jgi:hypothetical protein
MRKVVNHGKTSEKSWDGLGTVTSEFTVYGKRQMRYLVHFPHTYTVAI